MLTAAADPALAERHLQLECRVWDFAGQHEYYLTHKLFLRPGALNLLLSPFILYLVACIVACSLYFSLQLAACSLQPAALQLVTSGALNLLLSPFISLFMVVFCFLKL